MNNIKKILIANRGEIACRVIRTARKLNIQTIAIYSDIDKNNYHVKLADVAMALHGNASTETYLNQAKIIQIAKNLNVQAIHPGYGFLAENAEFAQQCLDNNIIFIGPSPELIKLMGQKDQAKNIMDQLGVPIIPSNPKDFPVLIKAVYGGGGKGMQVVYNKNELEEKLAQCKREALKAFGKDEVILEKYLVAPRHIEVQIFGDHHGNYIHLGTRECSIQRLNQKIIEEAPAAFIDPLELNKISEIAVAAARQLKYTGAGTFEFLYAENKFYFIEMNTRIQVEHPTTELITGQDLIEWQILVADNQKLPITKQTDLKFSGHAIEARIYAENPENNYPVTGQIKSVKFRAPENIRFDNGFIENNNISAYYDPLLSKLISWGENRTQAINNLQLGLKNLNYFGLANTNQKLLYNITNDHYWQNNPVNTDYLKNNLNLNNYNFNYEPILAAIYLTRNYQQKSNTWNNKKYFAWRLNAVNNKQIILYDNSKNKFLYITCENIIYEKHIIKFDINNKPYTINLKLIKNNYYFDNNYQIIYLNYNFNYYSFSLYHINNQSNKNLNIKNTDNNILITSPLPGIIIDILVTPGQSINYNDNLIIIESMKMEHIIKADTNGVIQEIFVNKNDIIEYNQLCIKMSKSLK